MTNESGLDKTVTYSPDDQMRDFSGYVRAQYGGNALQRFWRRLQQRRQKRADRINLTHCSCPTCNEERARLGIADPWGRGGR